MVDETHVEWRVSLDIDVADLASRARRYGLKAREGLPVPLVALKKELQLDLDVRGPSGEALSLETSDMDSRIAHAYFLAELKRSGVVPSRLSPSFLADSYRVVRSNAGTEELADIMRHVIAQFSGQEHGGAAVRMGTRDANLWYELVKDHNEVFELLADLAESYFLVVRVPVESPSIVIKYRRLVEQVPARFGLLGLSALGLAAIRLVLPIDSIGQASREHTRFVAPVGTRLTGGSLIAAENRGSSQALCALDARRITCYTFGSPEATHSLRVRLRPQTSSFFFPATIISLLIAFLGGVALFLESLSPPRFTGQPSGLPSTAQAASQDASVAILGVVPALFIAFLVQNGEHRLVGRMHTVPRLALLVEGLLLLVSAGAIAASVKHESLMNSLWITTVTATLASVYFAVVLIVTFGERLWLLIQGPLRDFITKLCCPRQ